MKHFINIIAVCASLWMVSVNDSNAQFHQKSTEGSTSVRQMNNPFNGTTSRGSYNRAPGIGNNSIKGSNLNIVGLSPRAVQMAQQNGVKIGISTIPLKEAVVWGRAENHPDGTYTETIVDDRQDGEDGGQFIVQKTRRKVLTWENMADPHAFRKGAMEDPIVLERRISLNAMGQPDEVMIYDGQGTYKYHGKFVYDRYGRLLEQQLRDARGNPLRRIIQEYDENGSQMPLKTVDYQKNIPKELQLVVTKMDPLTQDQLEKMENATQEAMGKGLLFRKRKKQQASQAAAQPVYQQQPLLTPPSSQAAPAEQGRKSFFRFRRTKK